MEKPFSRVYIEISNICNLQCSFCPEVIRAKKLISPELFRKIVRQVKPLTDLVSFHLMGDPLIHPKLGELIEICATEEMKIFFVTNGVLLRDEKMELLLSPAMKQVNFSLHSFHDNFGDKDPTEYLNRIFHFTERAFRERPNLYINYRLWNLSETRGTDSKNQGMLDRIEKHFEVSIPRDVNVKTRKSVHLKNKLYLHYDTEFVWPSLELPVLGTSGTCYGLSQHFGVLVDGTVVPCCLDKEGSIPLGNINDRDVQDILKDARAQNILNGFQNRKLVENLCQRCQYIERFS